jgi:hypothetical protein
MVADGRAASTDLVTSRIGEQEEGRMFGNGKRQQVADVAETPIDETEEVRTALAHEREVRKRFDKAEEALLQCHQALKIDVSTTSMAPEPTAAERAAAKRVIGERQVAYEVVDEELKSARREINLARARAAKTLSEARRPRLIELIQEAVRGADDLAVRAQAVQEYQLETVRLGGSFEYQQIFSRFVAHHGISSWSEEKKSFEQRGWF